MSTVFERFIPTLDQNMRQVIESYANNPTDFGLMLRYALGWVNESDQPHHHATGKRIRPILLMLCTEAAGGDWKHALPAATAVELLHNFSLIHDDIQDNSPTRHNRPTVWKIWGIANAINAGDAMFTAAYTALHELDSTVIPPQRILSIWNMFNRTCLELTRGQHLDMRFEHQSDVTIDEYVSMVTGKSAALISTCAQIGTRIASGDEHVSEQFAEFGLNLGLAFQIRDDILGIWGKPDVTGKSVATDIISRKKSLPVLFGLAQHPRLREVYSKEDFVPEDVHECVKLLEEVRADEYAHNIETMYYDKAFQALQQASPRGEAGELLTQLAINLFQRQS